MAFSLETTLVFPLVIASCLGFILLAVPAERQVSQAAALERQATVSDLDHQHLYQVDILRCGSVWATSLNTSPQSVIELYTLIRDDSRIIRRHWPDILTESKRILGGIA